MDRRKKFRLAISSIAFFIFLFCASNRIFANNESKLSGLAADLEKNSNKAVHIKINKIAFEQKLGSEQGSAEQTFFILETQWENIHPKQKIEKSKLEGKVDRTMGVGAFAGKKKKGEEYVEIDVVYKIRKLVDHVYLVADGTAFSLHKLTEEIPGGVKIEEDFTLSKKGDIRKANFVFLIPKKAENLGFQFFDYEYGHILIPIQGDIGKAVGISGVAGKVLDQIKSNLIEIAAQGISFRNEYQGEKAEDGWHYAIIYLSGKSLSGTKVKDIVQIDLKEYTWVTTQDGYFYYGYGGSTTEEGFIRFTPELYQSQEVAFLVPANAKLASLGLRIQNETFQLKLGSQMMSSMPKALAIHQDGETMEVTVYGLQKKEGTVILDLGIKSLAESGLEIQAEEQFMLIVGEEKISFDEEATQRLFHRPPTPFIIPPKTFIRFKLAYRTDRSPTSLYFRGYESEKYLSLK